MKVLISYSGGKDSQACLIWAIKKFGVNKCEAVYCDTGWENPITYEHIKNTTPDMFEQKEYESCSSFYQLCE